MESRRETLLERRRNRLPYRKSTATDRHILAARIYIPLLRCVPLLVNLLLVLVLILLELTAVADTEVMVILTVVVLNNMQLLSAMRNQTTRRTINYMNIPSLQHILNMIVYMDYNIVLDLV